MEYESYRALTDNEVEFITFDEFIKGVTKILPKGITLPEEYIIHEIYNLFYLAFKALKTISAENKSKLSNYGTKSRSFVAYFIITYYEKHKGKLNRTQLLYILTILTGYSVNKRDLANRTNHYISTSTILNLTKGIEKSLLISIAKEHTTASRKLLGIEA